MQMHEYCWTVSQELDFRAVGVFGCELSTMLLIAGCETSDILILILRLLCSA